MSSKKSINIASLETAQVGFANGISIQLSEKIHSLGKIASLTREEKDEIIENAAEAYGNFLIALGVDWKQDPNSNNTPKRVAKAYVNDLWRGRYELLGEITSFPSDGYKGIVLERDIPTISMCSHHHQTILGKVHIAYVAGENGSVVGLSKMNRIVEHFSRRGAIQEQLTVAIHNAINEIVEENQGVMVVIHATHNCVSCRGVGHMGASMITSEVSGVFADHTKTAKAEVMAMLNMNLQAYV